MVVSALAKYSWQRQSKERSSSLTVYEGSVAVYQRLSLSRTNAVSGSNGLM